MATIDPNESEADYQRHQHLVDETRAEIRAAKGVRQRRLEDTMFRAYLRNGNASPGSPYRRIDTEGLTPDHDGAWRRWVENLCLPSGSEVVITSDTLAYRYVVERPDWVSVERV